MVKLAKRKSPRALKAGMMKLAGIGATAGLLLVSKIVAGETLVRFI